MLLVCGIWYWRVYRFNLFPLEATAILLNSEDEWFVITNSNESLPAIERPGSFVHPLLVVLLLRCQNRNFAIILSKDNVHEELLRRLRVRLRFPVKTSDDLDHDDLNLR